MVSMESFIEKFQVINLRKVFLVGIAILYYTTGSYGQGSKVILGSGTISNVKYHVYEPYLLIKPIYKDTTQALNLYPEQLMSSIISSTSREWERYNAYVYDENESFEYVKGIEYELIAKLEFIANGTPTAIVKFQMIVPRKEKKVIGVSNMQKINGRWRTNTTTFTKDLAALVMVFKSDVLKNLLLNKPTNKFEEKLLKKTFADGLIVSEVVRQQYSEEERAYFLNLLNW